MDMLPDDLYGQWSIDRLKTDPEFPEFYVIITEFGPNIPEAQHYGGYNVFCHATCPSNNMGYGTATMVHANQALIIAQEFAAVNARNGYRPVPIYIEWLDRSVEHLHTMTLDEARS
jgi:hypothetical protein